MPVIQEPYDPAGGIVADRDDSQRVDAVVVGAGIAGLTAAFEMRQKGANVLVLESSPRVGGAIRTLHAPEGYLVERGPNTVLDTHPEVQQLIRRAGLEEEMIFAPETAKKRFVVRGGVPVELPASPGAFLRTRLFSTRAKLRLAAEPFIRKRIDDGEESIASFTTRRLGREFLDYAIDPFVSGVYAGRPNRLSVQQAFPKLAEVEERYGSLIVGQVRGARERKRRAETAKTAARMFSFRRGLEALPLGIAESLGETAVLTGCRVRSIRPSVSSWRIAYDAPDGRSREVEARSVVYAAGLQRTDVLDEIGSVPRALETIQYPPLNIVALGYRRSDVAHALDGFGLLVPSKENRFVLGALFSSTLFEDRAPDGHVLITAFVGGARNADFADVADAQLLDRTASDLNDLLGTPARPIWHDITRWAKAIPQYNLGYGSVKKALRDLESRNTGLFFAGNYVSGISVADSIRSGSDVGARASKYLQQQQNALS